MASAILRVPVSDADHCDGPEDAALVLVEYGDFQCPHCGLAYPITERLRQTLRGKLRFVFRHFPIPELHPDAQNAARASEAAGKQGRFWDMHGLLFQNQQELDPGNLMGHAAALGLNLFQFAEDSESGEVDGKVMGDFRGGMRSGVNGTPTFFINGHRYDGDWGYEPFLEALLGVSNPVTN